MLRGPPHATWRLPCTADGVVSAHWFAQPYCLHCRNNIVVATAELSPGGEREVACHHAAQHLQWQGQGQATACRWWGASPKHVQGKAALLSAMQVSGRGSCLQPAQRRHKCILEYLSGKQ